MNKWNYPAVFIVSILFILAVLSLVFAVSISAGMHKHGGEMADGMAFMLFAFLTFYYTIGLFVFVSFLKKKPTKMGRIFLVINGLLFSGLPFILYLLLIRR